MHNNKTALIFGATGQLGQAFMAATHTQGISAKSVARSNADFCLNIADSTAVEATITQSKPSLVINCAALVSLDRCEADPSLAHAINALAVQTMAIACKKNEARLIHISTDHYFTGDKAALHDEKAPVTLVNQYAHSKYTGEQFARINPDALIIRTNITGFRGKRGNPTFAEWLINTLKNKAPLTLFTDFYTSTLDCETCAQAVLDLVQTGTSGLYNVASRTCMNKESFARTLAKEMNITLDWATTSTTESLPTRRAESLGLNVSKAEAALGYELPDALQVIQNLVKQSGKETS